MSTERYKFNESDRAKQVETDLLDKAETLELAYLKHRQSLLAVAVNITQCQALAEDAIQAAFSRLVKSSSKPGNSNPGSDSLGANPLDDGKQCDPNNSKQWKAYIFQSVRNAALDIYRQRKRETERADSLFRSRSAISAERELDGDQKQVNNLIRDEEIQTMQTAIDELPSDDRELIVLKTYAGFTFDEIAVITKSNANTVATRYRRLLQKLRERLREHA